MPPGSIYTTHALLRNLHAFEAGYEQNSDRHPLLWSRSTSISTISRIPDSVREIFTTVVSRVLPHPSLLPFERTLSGQLSGVSCDPVKLRERQREDRLICYVKYYSDTVIRCFLTVPPRPHAKILVQNTGSPEDADLNRHEAHVTEENVECSSALSFLRVKHRPGVRSAVRVGKAGLSIIAIAFAIRLHHTRLWPCSIFVPRRYVFFFFCRLTNRSR